MNGQRIASNISSEFYLTLLPVGETIYLGYKTVIVGIVVAPHQISFFPQNEFLREKLLLIDSNIQITPFKN